MTAREDQYGFARRRIDEVQVVTLIAVETTEGSGEGEDVVHRVVRYYSMTGDFVAVSS